MKSKPWPSQGRSAQGEVAQPARELEGCHIKVGGSSRPTTMRVVLPILHQGDIDDLMETLTLIRPLFQPAPTATGDEA